MTEQHRTITANEFTDVPVVKGRVDDLQDRIEALEALIGPPGKQSIQFQLAALRAHVGTLLDDLRKRNGDQS